MTKKFNLHNVPAFDYYKAIETKDYSKIGGFNCFLDIQIEKYNEFGLSNIEKRILRLETGKLFNKLDMVINNDRFQLNLVEVKDEEIDSIKEKVFNEKSSFGKNCAILRKSGFQFDTMKITLFDFLYNLKLLEDEQHSRKNAEKHQKV